MLNLFTHPILLASAPLCEHSKFVHLLTNQRSPFAAQSTASSGIIPPPWVITTSKEPGFWFVLKNRAYLRTLWLDFICMELNYLVPWLIDLLWSSSIWKWSISGIHQSGKFWWCTVSKVLADLLYLTGDAIAKLYVT